MAQQRFLLTDALDLFLLDREAQNLSKKSLRTYLSRLSAFTHWLNGLDITTVGELTHIHIRQYQVHLVRTMADISAKNRMVDVKTFLRFCVDEQLIESSPADRVKLPRVVERIPEILSRGETKRMYEACESIRDQALFLTMLDTGVRAEEVINMALADVDIGAGIILIKEGKPRRDRITYISAQTRKALLKYIKSEQLESGSLWISKSGGKSLTESGLRQIIRKIAQKAGIKCTPHKIRKTFVTTLLRSNVDVYTLRRLSGHRSLEALQPYVALADVDAERAHRQNSPVETLL